MLDFSSYIPWWDYNILGNTAGAYMTAFGVFVAFLIIFFVIQKVLLWRFRRFAKKTKTDLDDVFVEIADSVKPPFYSAIAFYIASSVLTMPDLARSILAGFVIVVVVYQVVVALQIFINYIFGQFLARRLTGNGGTKAALQALQGITKWSLWLLAILIIVQNFGVNITSLIAGLGIGGIALALAAQSVLGDLFSSFALLFDKPFEPGDFIVVGEHMGTVEKIGIKTTRLRALQGEEIIIPNKELTDVRVQNFKKMQERRVVFQFGVVYETPQDKLEAIPGMVGEIIGPVDSARFDRTHFFQFGDSALNFETVYYVKSGDYNEYMDIHQNILMGINKAFAEHNISMAYPTRTIYMQKTPEDGGPASGAGSPS